MPKPMRGANRPKKPSKKNITITDAEHGLPFSKGLLARSVMATGLTPGQAYQVAVDVEKYLEDEKIHAISAEQLRSLVYEVLESQISEEVAEKYLRWQALGQLDKPLIVLFGGTTGVGKSTIATEVAHRLNITRIVATDTIREVMRGLFSNELMPALYKSSYDAWESVKIPLPEAADPVTVGFMEQTRTVRIGIEATISRAIKEGYNMVMEGVHIVPGFLDVEWDQAFVIPLVVSVEEESMHKSHFYLREVETDGARAFERYKANFEQIRTVGKFIESRAEEQKVTVIKTEELDEAVVQVMEEISRRVIDGGDPK